MRQRLPLGNTFVESMRPAKIVDADHRTPTLTQQARWEAVQQAKRQGLSLRAIARKLAMSRVAASKYALAESPPTKLLSAKERARAEAMAASLIAAV